MKTKLVLLLILILPGIGFSQPIQLRLASDVWPPFTNKFGEKAFAKALVEEALSRGQIQEQTKILEFQDVVEGIRQGDYDGSAALWKIPERESFLLFSEPYLENRLVLVGRKGSDVSASDFSTLTGKRIGIVGNYAYGEALDAASNLTLVKGSSDQDNLNRLQDGEVDYILVDDLLVQYLLTYQNEEMLENLAVGDRALLRRSLHFAIRKDHPKASFIIDQFNSHILDMIADGTYNRILELNWIHADVDGDGRLELVLGGDQAGVQPPLGGYNLLLYGASRETKPADRYFIEGKVYEGWNTVPQKYKVPVKPEDLNKPGATLRLKF